MARQGNVTGSGPSGANSGSNMGGNRKLIERPYCELDREEPTYREIVRATGLSWVEFHALSNAIFDSLDPKFGKGLKYTFEEIERNCAAREQLARALAKVNNRREEPITDEDIARVNRNIGEMQKLRVLKFVKRQTARNAGNTGYSGIGKPTSPGIGGNGNNKPDKPDNPLRPGQGPYSKS